MADRSDMSTVKILESGKHARELLAKLSQPQLTPREMSDLLCLIDKEPSVLKLWISALDQTSVFGARAFARSSPTAAVEIGLDQAGLQQVDEENERDPWQIPRVRAKFSNECRIQFSLKMNSMDALSQLGALAFNDPRDSERWIAVNPAVWVSWAGRGNNAIIKGAVKRGKSNLALLMCEMFLKAGFQIVSNIILTDPPKGYICCSRLSDMLTAICRSRLDGKEVLIVLDEANLFWQKIETIMPRNISLAKLILCYGKMHANLLFVSHYEELIPGIVSKTAVAVFEKKSIKECFVSINEGIRLRPKLLTAVPATTLKYDPDQLAFFSINLDVNGLFDFMASIPEGENQWQSVLGYVGKHQGEAGEEQLNPKEIAIWMKKRGKSVREIASVVQRSVSTVHDWTSLEPALAERRTEQQ